MSHSDVRPWTLQCLWRVMAHYDSVQVQFADFIWSQVLVWRPDSIMGSGRGFCMASMKLVGYPSSGCVLFNSFRFHCLVHIVLHNLIGDSQAPSSQLIVRSELSNGEVIVKFQTSHIECTCMCFCMVKSQYKAVAHVLLAVFSRWARIISSSMSNVCLLLPNYRSLVHVCTKMFVSCCARKPSGKVRGVIEPLVFILAWKLSCAYIGYSVAVG